MDVNKMIVTVIGVVVLLFLTPVVNGIAADIAADVNTSPAQATIVEFIPTLYVLSILAAAAVALFHFGRK